MRTNPVLLQYAMKRFGILACVRFILVAAGSLHAQQFGNIVGELHVIRGDFPGRILIELQLHGAPIASQYTDEQGKFAFGSLTNNLYHVVVRDEHFEPVDQTAILDVSITAVTMVQINLMPRPPTRQDSLPAQRGSNPFMVDTEQYRRSFPKKALKEFDKGLESDREGKRDDAIRHYEKALSLAPDFYPAHNNLGSDYLSRSDFKAAQAQFEEAIKLNQSDPQAHLNLGNLNLMTKNYDDALQNVQEGLRRRPNSALGQFLLGSIYERLRKLPEAERALRTALSIDPAMSRVRLELVNLYLAQKDRLKATSELKAFLQNAPDDPLVPKAKELLNKLEATR